MTRTKIRSRAVTGALAILTGLALLVAADTSRASTFEVSPVTLTLSQDSTSGVIAIKNEGTDTMRVQVTAFAWNQSPAGEVQLTPTTDVVFFPSLISVAAGDTRNLRVGIPSSSGRERSYRVFIEELPPIHARATSGVRVLTRMGIPVFSAPTTTQAVPQPRIEAVHAESSVASFAIANGGDGHFVARHIQMSVRDEHDDSLFETDFTGWYVLSGGTRVYEVPVPASACAHTRSIRIIADTTVGSVSSNVTMRCSAQGN